MYPDPSKKFFIALLAFIAFLFWLFQYKKKRAQNRRRSRADEEKLLEELNWIPARETWDIYNTTEKTECFNFSLLEIVTW